MAADPDFYSRLSELLAKNRKEPRGPKRSLTMGRSKRVSGGHEADLYEDRRAGGYLQDNNSDELPPSRELDLSTPEGYNRAASKGEMPPSDELDKIDRENALARLSDALRSAHIEIDNLRGPQYTVGQVEVDNTAPVKAPGLQLKVSAKKLAQK